MRLGELLDNPAAVDSLTIEDTAALRGELARLDSLLLNHLTAAGRSTAESGPDRDHLLDVKEAAVLLRLSADHLYRHASQYPFTVRVGRRLRFSVAGINRYIRQRAGQS